MRKAVLTTLLLVLVLSPTLALIACGTPSSSAPNATADDVLKSDFRYTGKLDTEKDALDAVLAFLHSEADSDAAKLYLSEYLMVVSYKYVKPSEDKQTWYVSFLMDRKPSAEDGEKPYWDGAAWVAFKDGKVMPSSRHNSNAVRIIQDLRVASR
ncbi:MAG: hypothetical protein AB1603_00295 [Chloroflexota bacterium]